MFSHGIDPRVISSQNYLQLPMKELNNCTKIKWKKMELRYLEQHSSTVGNNLALSNEDKDSATYRISVKGQGTLSLALLCGEHRACPGNRASAPGN